MQIFKRLTKITCLTLLLTMLFSMTALASETAGAQPSTGDAIQDILQDDRFQGALSSISKITEFVDIWFIRIISIISFFIISAALLKNACAGAYCANSKFWDKVDDAHKKNEAISISTVRQYFGGGQFQNTSVGGLRDFLLGLIPNIKAFTDFDDADIEPKAYFMKAIPQMIACVIIGVFIYNGFYRDTAAKVGEMGSVIVSRTLSSVNPESLVNSVFNMTSWPDFPWESDPSEQGKGYNKVANEVKSLVSSNFPDVTTAEAKSQTVSNIVNAINTDGGNISWDSAGDGYIYKMSKISSYLSAETGMENLTYGCNLVNGTEGVSDLNYMWVFNMSDIVPASTALNSATKAGYVSFTLKREVMQESDQQLSGVDSTVADDATVDALSGLVSTGVTATVPSAVLAISNGKATQEATIRFEDFALPADAVVEFKNTNQSQRITSVKTDAGTMAVKIKVDAKLDGEFIEGTGTKVAIGFFVPAGKTNPQVPAYIIIQ